MIPNWAMLLCTLLPTGKVLYCGEGAPAYLDYNTLGEKCKKDLLREFSVKLKGQYDNDMVTKRHARFGKWAALTGFLDWYFQGGLHVLLTSSTGNQRQSDE